MKRTIDIDLTYQPLIDGPPAHYGNLHSHTTKGDDATVEKWREKWISHYKANHETFGGFAQKSAGQLYGANRHRPAIVLGSGPSLKHSIEALKENADMEHPLMTVSCLHNFGYFEDEGFHADYYLTLDSGSIVLDDVTEGRQNLPEYYWEKTEGKTLLAFTATDPELFKKWRGEIYFFNCLIPSEEVQNAFNEVERFTMYVSSGGNALGACLYVAKTLFCSDVIHFVGADFCFDYNNQFHSYKTHYDQPGQFVRAVDVFGMPRKTWPSYLNFKYWFDYVATQVPGIYVNCSEGLLGAYPEGNIVQFQYKSLKDALIPYKHTQKVTLESRKTGTNELIGKEDIRVEELFSNSAYEKDLILF